MTSSNFPFLNHVEIASLVTVFDADFNGVIGFTINVHLRLVAPPIISASAKTSYNVKQDENHSFLYIDKW